MYNALRSALVKRDQFEVIKCTVADLTLIKSIINAIKLEQWKTWFVAHSASINSYHLYHRTQSKWVILQRVWIYFLIIANSHVSSLIAMA